MASLTLIYGPAATDKSHPLRDACQSYIDTGNSTAFIYLTTTQRRANHIQKHFLTHSINQCLTAPYIYSLEDFFKKLYRRLPKRRPLLPPSASRLFIETSLNTLKQELRFFQHANLNGSLLPELLHLFSSLKYAGITPTSFAKDRIQFSDLNTDKGKDLEQLYYTYQYMLDQSGITSEDLLDAIAALLVNPDTFSRCFPGVELLCLESPNSLSAPLRKVFTVLLPNIPKTLVTLDYIPAHPQFFAPTQPLYDFFISLAHTSTCYSPPPPTHLGPQLAPLLMSTSTSTRASLPAYLTPYPDRLAEVTHIARQLCNLIRENQILPNHIGLAFPALDHYIPLLNEVLPQFGLSYSLPYGERLADAPIIAATMAILDTILNQYSRESLLRLLNLPYIALPAPTRSQRPALNATDLDYATRQIRPAGGRSGWLSTLSQHIEHLEHQLTRLPQHNLTTDNIDTTDRLAASLHQQLERLRHLHTNLQAFFAITSPLEENLSLESFRERLRQAMDQLGIMQHLIPSRSLAIRPQLAHLAQRDICALSRLGYLLDELVVLHPYLKNHRFSLTQLTAILRSTIGTAHYQAQAITSQDVQILPLSEIATSPIDVLFIGGLNEGEWPRRSKTDIFLSDSTRRQLGLPLASTIVAADRLSFYQALTQVNQQVYLSYPRQDAGTALLPSPLLEPLQSAIQHTAPQTNPLPTRQRDLHIQLATHLQYPVNNPLANKALQLFYAARQVNHLASPLKHLLHALHLNAARQTSTPGPYEGILDQAAHMHTLAQRFAMHYPFSITQLETYARCPFSFFTERLLDIAPTRDPEEDLSALDRGNLIHETLFHYYTERQAKALPARLMPTEQRAALQQLRDIAHQVAKNMGLTGFFWERELERIVGRPEADTIIGLLPRFVTLEANDADPAEPRFFEFSFGSAAKLGVQDPKSSQEPLVLHGDSPDQKVNLLGKIDRIDVAADGRFMVLDYKTGKIPANIKEIQRGTSLQLPIYLLAAEHLLADEGLSEGSAGAYYQMRDHENIGKQGLFADANAKGAVFHSRSRSLLAHDDFRKSLEQSRSHVFNYVNAIRKGRFHLTRHAPEEVCSHCPYRQSCRLDTQRQRTLDKAGHLKS